MFDSTLGYPGEGPHQPPPLFPGLESHSDAHIDDAVDHAHGRGLTSSNALHALSMSDDKQSSGLWVVCSVVCAFASFGLKLHLL